VPKVTARNSTPVALTGTPLHLSVEFCSNPPAHAARWLHGDRIYTPGNQYGGEVFVYGFTSVQHFGDEKAKTTLMRHVMITHVTTSRRYVHLFRNLIRNGHSFGSLEEVDLPTPHCKEARLTYVHMHEKVPRTFYFVVSSPGGVAEAVFKVNYTLRQTKANGSYSASSSHSGPGSHGNSFSSSSAGSSSSSVSGVSSNINGGLSGYKIGPNTINTVPGNGLDDDEELMEPEEIHFPIFGTGRATFAQPSRPLLAASLCILLHFGILGAVLTSSWLIDTAVTLHGTTIR
uniref:Uncharacterized protein n=1 Tax=Anopheles maculatus TaxID=74869 RepID=A0A182SGD8_9DIPT